MENVKLFLSQKSQFHLVERIKNKNKKRTRASLFQSSEDGNLEIFFTWPYVPVCLLQHGPSLEIATQANILMWILTLSGLIAFFYSYE